MEYDDRHRIFLQGIMNYGVLSGSTAITLLQKAYNISGHTLPSQSVEINQVLRRLTDSINKEIRSLNLAIVKAIDENKMNKETFLILVNQSDRSEELTELTKKSMVEFAPHELEFLKILIAEMMKGPAPLEDEQNDEESDEEEENESFVKGEIDKTRALNLSSKVKSKVLKPLEAQEILDKFVEKNWLRSSENEVICFTPRFIAEMETYLRAVYPNEVSTCSLCNKIVIKSLLCTCNKHFHLYCLGAAVPKGKNRSEVESIPCPKCKKPIFLNNPSIKDGRRKRSLDEDLDTEEDI